MKNMRKDNLKKTGMAFSSFLIVGILISTVTAMPYINNMETQDLGDIKEQALIQINKPNIINAINTKKAEIISKINTYPLKQRTFLMNYFNINETFDINKMIQRINSLDINNILSDIQDLTKLPDNYDELNTTENQQKIKELLLMMDSNDYVDLFCPICDLICLAIFAISYTYAIFLISIFEEFGIFLTDCITLILFAPVYLPIAFYCAFLYGCSYDEYFKEDIEDLLYHNHVVGAITYIMLYCFTTGLPYGLEHVFFYILWTEAELNPNGLLFVTGETVPFADSWEADIDHVSGYTVFNVYADDSDIMRYEQNSNYRDYLQLGFDWDNDMSIDYWTGLCYDTVHPIGITVEKTFDSGEHIVNCFVRDNWGLISDPICFSFEITNDNNQDMSNPNNDQGASKDN